jgi:hypothetical protein
VSYRYSRSLAFFVLNVARASSAQTRSQFTEFDVQILVHFHDPALLPVTFSHKLKLYPAPGAPYVVDAPLVDEIYDELVFNVLPAEGSEARARLLAGPSPAAVVPPYPYQAHFGSFGAEADLARIQGARR